MRVFIDDRDIEPGHNMVEAIVRGLEQSRYVCPVVSPNSVMAEWPPMEWSIAISSDPSGRKGRIIPLWLGGCSIPAVLLIRHALYFDNDEHSNKSYKKLVSTLKGESNRRANIVLDPTSANHDELFPTTCEDDVDEQLLSNLFPVSAMPETVWYGPTRRTNEEVYRHLTSKVSGILPTFIVKNRKIFCFWNLNAAKCPFRGLLSAAVIENDSVSNWIDNVDKNRWLMELLNKGMKHHCRNLDLWFDNTHKRYLFSPLYGSDRTISWNTGRRKSTRTVVKKYTRGVSGDVFWAHQTLKAKFTTVGRDIFLQLDPGWTFTADGSMPLPKEQIGPLSVKWTTKEHNSSMLYHIRFWSSYLSQHHKSIVLKLGDSPCTIDTTPGIANMNKGLEDDTLHIDKVFDIADEENAHSEVLRDVLAKTDGMPEYGTRENRHE